MIYTKRKNRNFRPVNPEEFLFATTMPSIMRAITCLLFFTFHFLAGVSAQFNLNGSAQVIGPDCYAVTPAQQWQNGSVWYTGQLNLLEPFDIQLVMSFGTNNDPGADGVVFVLQTQGPNALGNNGGGMGFQGFSPSIGVEFDTFPNDNEGDPYYDHMAIHRNGNVNHNSANNLAGPVQASANSDNIEDGLDHTFRITWNPQTFLLEAYFDCQLRLSINYNMVLFTFNLNPNVYFGFTAATGNFFNEHKVCLDPQILGLDDSYSICEGESVLLSVAGPENGSYEWSPQAGLSDPFSRETEASPETTTEYFITYTDLCGNTRNDSTIVEVISPEVFLGEDFSLCASESQTIGVPALAGYSYTWNDGFAGNSRTGFPGNEYWIEASFQGCTVRDTLTIGVLDEPAPDLGEDFSACEGETVILDIGFEGFGIEWNNGSGSSEIEVTESGTYSVVVTDPGSGCFGSDEAEVVFIAVPQPALPAEIAICEGETAELSAGVNADFYSWNTGAITESITVSEGGEYTVSTSNANCMASASCSLVVNALPNPNLGADRSFCEGESVELSVLNNAGWLLTWQGLLQQSAFFADEPGMYTVIAEDAETGCYGYDEVTLYEILLPQITGYEEITFCEEDRKFLSVLAERADSAVWNTGSQAMPLEIEEAGVYSLEAFNSCGSVFHAISVSTEPCDCRVYVPNAFSPNEDGNNEVFFPVFDCDLREFRMEIYDRWGERIFKTESLTEPWNGEYSGDPVQDGVYIWRLYYSSRIGNVILNFERSGHVTVIR